MIYASRIMLFVPATMRLCGSAAFDDVQTYQTASLRIQHPFRETDGHQYVEFKPTRGLHAQYLYAAKPS